MVYSASAVIALERFQQPYLFLTKQALWSVLGLAVLGVAMRVDYRTYRNEAFIWCLLALVLLMLVAVLFSAPVNGTRRWFGVGIFLMLGIALVDLRFWRRWAYAVYAVAFALLIVVEIAGDTGMGAQRWIDLGPVGIQPSEMAKVACVFFTALMLERRMHRIDDLSYSLLPIGLIIGLVVALILLQPDFGTSMSLALVVAVMVFAAGLHYRYFVGLALVALPAVYLVLVAAPYRRRRLLAFWDPWADPLGDGFQIIQSLVAVGTGGVFGRGLMGGVQKLFYLPEPHTDFIYAVIGEELGLIGATAILLCFCVIAWRGLRISARAEDVFGSFVALGLTTMIAAQALVNISVVLGLIPTKGIPLPLVSFGGSSLLINLLGTGVLLNISQHESADA